MTEHKAQYSRCSHERRYPAYVVMSKRGDQSDNNHGGKEFEDPRRHDRMPTSGIKELKVLRGFFYKTEAASRVQTLLFQRKGKRQKKTKNVQHLQKQTMIDNYLQLP